MTSPAGLKAMTGAAVDDPHVVVGVYRDADHHAEQRLVGQRLGPQRIDLKDWRLHQVLLRRRRAL
jgi:hypothetical protein